MLKGKTIGFIGTGKIAEAIIKGLIASGKVSPAQIKASDIDKSRRLHMAEAYQIKVFNEAPEVVELADIVLIAVKPAQVEEVLIDIARNLVSEKLIVSVAAGITTGSIREHLKSGGVKIDIPVVRAMPNTPAIVGEGVTGIAAGKGAKRADMDLALELFSAVGTVTAFDDEAHLDAVTGLSGSGPAFVFYFMEAMLDAGVKEGIEYEEARELALRTTLGAAKLALESGTDLIELRRMVSSPNGTTVAGLNKLEEARFYDIMVDAVRSAIKRARELSC